MQKNAEAVVVPETDDPQLAALGVVGSEEAAPP
jgi:hypothetical protein